MNGRFELINVVVYLIHETHIPQKQNLLVLIHGRVNTSAERIIQG
jgi:hypothetical protein